jgi:hypothetical protein
MTVQSSPFGATTTSPFGGRPTGSVFERLQGIIVSAVLHNWIYIGSNAYAEYTFVPWLGRNIYRRTVDLSAICIQ